MRRLPRGISLCLAAPEAVAGRGVFDGEIVAIAEAAGLYACRVAAGENLALVLNLHHVHGGLAIILFHCLVSFLFDYYFTSVIHINALHAGLAAELATVEGVPCVSRMFNVQC